MDFDFHIHDYSVFLRLQTQAYVFSSSTTCFDKLTKFIVTVMWCVHFVCVAEYLTLTALFHFRCKRNKSISTIMSEIADYLLLPFRFCVRRMAKKEIQRDFKECK